MNGPAKSAARVQRGYAAPVFGVLLFALAMAAGVTNSVAWNATDEGGRRLANGVYIVHLETRQAAVIRRWMFLQ